MKTTFAIILGISLSAAMPVSADEWHDPYHALVMSGVGPDSSAYSGPLTGKENARSYAHHLCEERVAAKIDSGALTPVSGGVGLCPASISVPLYATIVGMSCIGYEWSWHDRQWHPYQIPAAGGSRHGAQEAEALARNEAAGRGINDCEVRFVIPGKGPVPETQEGDE